MTNSTEPGELREIDPVATDETIAVAHRDADVALAEADAVDLPPERRRGDDDRVAVDPRGGFVNALVVEQRERGRHDASSMQGYLTRRRAGSQARV